MGSLLCIPPEGLNLDCCKCAESFSAEEQASALASAWAAIQAATCYRHRDCYATIKPCVPCSCGRSCRDSCGANYDPLDLQWPLLRRYGHPYLITELVQVQINGEVQDLSDGWRLDECRWLVREAEDGNPPCWPTQDLARPLGAECTWSVTVRFGAIPELLVQWANELACGILEHCDPDVSDEDCSLPDDTEMISFGGPDGPTIKIAQDVATGSRTGRLAKKLYGCTPRLTRMGLPEGSRRFRLHHEVLGAPTP